MREFKNPKNCRGMSRSLELHWEAMGLRAMADDIEDGIDNGIEIDDEEER